MGLARRAPHQHLRTVMSGSIDDLEAIAPA